MRLVATAGLTTHDPGDPVGVVGGQAQHQRAAHREARDHDRVVGGGEPLEGPLHLGVPVVPRGRVHVLPGGAVARAAAAPPRRTPAPRGARPRRASEYGEPVKPWLSSTPIRRPPVSSGRASATQGLGEGVDVHARHSARGRRPAWRTAAATRAGSRLPATGRAREQVWGGSTVFYWFLKWVAIGPVLRMVFRPRTEGAESVPAEGPAILASNHLSYADWLFMPLTLPRRVTFVAKAEYFNTPGLKGWFQKKFFAGSGQVPIDRSGNGAAEGALLAAKRVLDEGELFGIYPEGTRSHDGRLYRGKVGVARLALETGVPVIPVAVVGTDVVAPPGQEVRLLHPPDGALRQAAGLLALRGHGERPLHPALDHRRDHVRDHAALRAGVRRPVRRPRQGGVQAAREGGWRRRPRRRAGDGRAEEGVLSLHPAGAAADAGRVPRHGAAARAVEDRMFRALAVLRVVVLLNAVALNLYRADNFAHPLGGVACVVVMVVWTGGGGVGVRRRAAPHARSCSGSTWRWRSRCMLLSPVVKGPSMQATVPGFWVMGALLAWALHWRWLGGLVAGVLLALADVAVRHELDQTVYGNLFLILVGGPIVGFMAASLTRMADERDEPSGAAAAERAAAAAAERARLARAVHDGVLQVLALVQRRGAELGGEAAGLGRLAGEQEAALRALIRSQDGVAAVARPATSTSPRSWPGWPPYAG